MIKNNLYLIAIFTLSSGLLIAPSATQGSSYSFYGTVFANYKQEANKGGGCISGSVGTTVPGKNFNFTVNFASEANNSSSVKLAYFGFTTLDKRHDVVVDTLRASVFRMCLKPGNYELVGISALGQYSVDRVHVPFKVEAGKHIYIGSFVLHTAESRPEKCSQVLRRMFVEVRDEHLRDLPIIMKPEKSVGIDPTVSVVASSTGQPYFVSCNG